jgi:probable HAF family extracellular repeat protein
LRKELKMQHKLFRLFFVLTFVIGLAVVSGPQSARAAGPSTIAYTLTDLGTFGGNYSQAIAINEAGQVIGIANIAGDTSYHAFMWDSGVMTDLGTLGGGSSGPNAINESGQIVGYSNLAGDAETHAFIWDGGVMTDLGSLGGNYGYATAINEAGQVIGNANTAGNASSHAFVWDAGVMTDLGTLDGSLSNATAINEAGQVIGYAYTGEDTPSYNHAFVWGSGVMTDLGTLGGSFSIPVAINEAGQIVGYSYLVGDAELHAFLWDSGVMTDLGTLGGSNSYVTAINEAGQIVGYSTLAGDVELHSFLWDAGVMTDLGTFGGSYTIPVMINEAGQIVGYSTTVGGQQHAFVWANGVMTDVGSLGGNYSYATAINEAGQVIGSVNPSGNASSHAFVWDGGVMTDLGTLGGSNSNASAINEAGQIVGYAYTAGDVAYHAFVMEARLVNRPANDNFANAEAISLPFNATTEITMATTEPGEPQPCYYSMERTVWYSFTPTENTGILVNTLGSTINRNVNIYRKAGPGISDLTFLNCAVEENSFSFLAEAGQTYYLQVGSVFGEVGTIQINLEQFPTPSNDNFDKATVIPSPLPFDDTFDVSFAGAQTGEPRPSCADFGVNGTVWYAFTPTQSGSLSAKLSAPFFSYTLLAVYSGNSLASLTELGCSSPYGATLTFHVDAGTTYYFQAGNYISNQGASIQFHLDVAPQPVASFYTNPFDPSKYDTVQFQDNSSDPGNVGLQTYTWNFGDGSTASGYFASHKYAADGDYQVTHTVTTIDGRTATITQTVQVRTHDVAITKITTPASANVGQTKTITVTLRNIAYPETVQIDLYKSTPNGFVWIATVTKSVPALSGNRTTAANFSYKFTSDDAKLGKVTFKAVATIVGARDSYPSDNEKISLITKVAR